METIWKRISIIATLGMVLLLAGIWLLMSQVRTADAATVTLLPPGHTWEYTFTDPTGDSTWNTTTGVGGIWSSGPAPFGNDGPDTEFDPGTFWAADGLDGDDLWVRTLVDLTGIDLSTVLWGLGVDNGFKLYANGVLVASGNAEGYTFRWEYTGDFGATLVPGLNVIAVALEDHGGATAFDMEITGTPQCVVPPSGLVGWWPGDSNAGDIAGGNDGTLQGGATFGAGKVGDAFSFAGSGSSTLPAAYVSVPDSEDFTIGGNPFSIDAWARFSSFTTFHTILSHDEGAGPNNKWIFYTTPNRLNFHIEFLSGGHVVLGGNWTPATDTWYHLAVTRDSANVFRFYVNGVALTPATTVGTIPVPSVIPNPSAPLWLGGAPELGFGMNGLLDEVEFFNRALTAEEIQAIFLAGSAGKCKNQAPVAQCQNVTTNTSPGLCTAPASVNNGSFDPDGDPITLSQTPAGPYAKGTTNVTLTVTDDKGASDSCTATVTAVDNQAPSITCPAPQTVECTGSGSAVASFSATATDNCGFASTSCPASGSSFPLGTTPVSCSASDDSNNSSSCSSSVTVQDTTAPSVSCVASVNPSGKNVPKASNTNQDGFYKVGASDICSTPTIKLGGYTLANGETIKITQTPGKSGVSYVNTMGPAAIRHFQVGPGDAVITATDGSGNASTATCLVPPPPK